MQYPLVLVSKALLKGRLLYIPLGGQRCEISRSAADPRKVRRFGRAKVISHKGPARAEPRKREDRSPPVWIGTDCAPLCCQCERVKGLVSSTAQ